MTRIGGVVRPDGQYQPELAVQVVTPNVGFLVVAIVDSGADITLLPSEDLEAYGVRYEDLEEIKNGKGQGVGEECSFEFRKLTGYLRWQGGTFANEIFVTEPGKMNVGLLGRADFFKTFKVSFEGWARRSAMDGHLPLALRLPPGLSGLLRNLGSPLRAQLRGPGFSALQPALAP